MALKPHRDIVKYDTSFFIADPNGIGLSLITARISIFKSQTNSFGSASMSIGKLPLNKISKISDEPSIKLVTVVVTAVIPMIERTTATIIMNKMAAAAPAMDRSRGYSRRRSAVWRDRRAT